MKHNIIIPKGQKHIKKTRFEGSAFFNVVAMYFLSHKHENCCVIFPNNYEPDYSIHIDDFFNDGVKHVHDEGCVLLPKKIKNIPDEQTKVSLRWIQKKRKKSKKNKIITSKSLQNNLDGYISVPKNFWDKFNKCPSSKRFVVFPFGFTCIDSGHANYMLYDTKNKTLERFETFGKVISTCLNPPDLDKDIFELFSSKLGNDITYYPPLSFLPSENFQTKQENEKEWINRNEDDEPVGYCAVWCVWYIDLRLSNPNIDREELVKIALKKLENLPITFTSFIRNYSGIIVEVSKEIEKLYKS